ncbi:hypothetical protein [Sulfurirhabdus autotrophica]|uniref:Uncharacterized protein n=1 Tax=Sulfurirhabdus autotrophica TaxID=1706046 RepID=A0A4R3XXY4_9PROT|nr:hypothetical protein [Sulfurirhabdus autotrophica]TCV82513.1 hypothetical protein EDC63_1207 [Sulfurirhabdus autotrophica]
MNKFALIAEAWGAMAFNLMRAGLIIRCMISGLATKYRKGIHVQ